jgi:hypothetical protein
MNKQKAAKVCILFCRFFVCDQNYFKRNLKIPKGYSEFVNRRTDNIMPEFDFVLFVAIKLFSRQSCNL